jgi:hypothetical protein
VQRRWVAGLSHRLGHRSDNFGANRCRCSMIQIDRLAAEWPSPAGRLHLRCG